MAKIRVRFAPSPTGPLHIGGLRTALYNYLFARQHKGTMILRIEDTDQTRYVEGAEEYIYKSLAWAGIEIDEGPKSGGDYGPYRQSQRKGMYKDYALKLVEEGKAYFAFDTPEELEEMREKSKTQQNTNPQYDAMTRNSMKNSLTLSEKEVDERVSKGEPYVIRLKVPENQDIKFIDSVREEVSISSSVLDDKVILKSDGMPTYHLANVVDDHLMEISHVIRGEEWLPSAPLHILLYQYLGWTDSIPHFAHLPLLLKPDGNGKLSKRDALKHGFPIFPLHWTDPKTGESLLGFKEEGYLPEAFINFLAFLGWNPGTEQELFTKEALIQSFSIDRVGKGGAKFDIDKAKWFNQEYLKLKSPEQLVSGLENLLAEKNIDLSHAKALRIIQIMNGRITFLNDIWEEARYFFERPKEYDAKVIKKRWNEETANALTAYKDELKSVETRDFTADKAKAVLESTLERQGMKVGKIMQVLRVALTGVGGGPDLMETMEVLGKNEVISRIEIALDSLT